MSHRSARSMHRVAASAMIASSPLLSGCVVGEIRDELRTANANLASLQVRVEIGNEMLDLLAMRVEQVEQANALLEEGNRQLASVGTQLEIMESIQSSLGSIDASLGKLDVHLASLRSTIESIDSTIPFLNLSGDAEAKTPPETTQSPPESPPESPPGTTDTSADRPDG